jgi:hypothetical protein
MQEYSIVFSVFRLQVLLGTPQNHHRNILQALLTRKSTQRFIIIF